MYKKLLILFVLLLSGIIFFSSTAFADPVNPTIPFYWIIGNLSVPNPNPSLEDQNAQAVDVDSRTIIFYKDDVEQRIETTTNADGDFVLNAFELYFNYEDIDINFVDTYKLAAPRIQDNYGDEVDLALIEAQGFVVQNLVLTWNDGPVINGATLTGTVTNKDTGDPLDATVTIQELGISVISSVNNGQYVIGNIPPGIYNIVCQKNGYKTITVGSYQFEPALAEVVNFQLEPEDEEDPGTITGFVNDLMIERDDHKLKLTWTHDPLFDEAKIVALVGDGTGQYNNDTFYDANADLQIYGEWILIDILDAETVGGVHLDVEDVQEDGLNRTLDINHQSSGKTGGGSTYVDEIYFKAVYLEGGEGEISDPEGLFAQAPAVGKFDIQLYQGLSNMNADPFIPNDLDINVIFGSQLPNNTMLSMRDPSGKWNEVIYNNGWSSPLDMDPNYGFWINVASGNPKITLVGAVDNSQQKTIDVWPGLNNLLGSAYPVQVALDDSLLGDALGADGGRVSAFSNGIWYEPEYNNGSWSDLSYKLKPTFGFWVNKHGDQKTTWSYPKLY